MKSKNLMTAADDDAACSNSLEIDEEEDGSK